MRILIPSALNQIMYHEKDVGYSSRRPLEVSKVKTQQCNLVFQKFKDRSWSSMLRFGVGVGFFPSLPPPPPLLFSLVLLCPRAPSSATGADSVAPKTQGDEVWAEMRSQP